MSNLKAGFARVDVTPNIGYSIEGGYNKRIVDGILDPLYATAIVFDDGENKAVIISLDAIGMPQATCEVVRNKVAEKVGTSPEAVYMACTHSHLSLGFRFSSRSGNTEEENEMKIKTAENTINKICDAALLAVADLKPAKLFCSTGEADGIIFIRRYRMSDGTVNTFVSPEHAHAVVGACAEVDKTVNHLIIKREEGFDIGIVNFPVHPDSIGGLKISADYPKFVRDTYEKLIDNSRCMFLTGTQGDCNGTNIYLPIDHPAKRSYLRARRMGRMIAMAAVSNYEMAEPLEGDKISFVMKNVKLKHNKETNQEDIDYALKIAKIKADATTSEVQKIIEKEKGIPIIGKNPWNTLASFELRRLLRIADLVDKPDETEVPLTAISIGDVAFSGFPGEPFTKVGTEVRKNSKFKFTITTCATNGYEGYFPTEDAFKENGYEANTAKYACGTAEKLIDEATGLLDKLYENK